MPNFAEKVEVAVDSLTSSPQREVDENEFIDASRLVYDGVRDIRRAVLMNRVSGTSSRSSNSSCSSYRRRSSSTQVKIDGSRRTHYFDGPATGPLQTQNLL